MHIWKLESLHCDIRRRRDVFPLFLCKILLFFIFIQLLSVDFSCKLLFFFITFSIMLNLFFKQFSPFLWEHFSYTIFTFLWIFPINWQLLFINLFSFVFLSLFSKYFSKNTIVYLRTSIRSNGLNKTERKKNK